jgi:hypothetical protein
MRRYHRNFDPYQTTEKLSELLARMKSAVYPDGISTEIFKKLLFAIQHVERHSARESKSGRRSLFDRDFLLKASARIKGILQAETNGRISLLRFVSTYLPVLDYPNDIKTALNDYKINLEEARILSRINRETLGVAIKRKPSEIRKDLIDSHLKRQGTQAELKRRVDERLNLTPKKQVENLAARVAVIDANVDEFLEFNEFDTEHLLWEEIKGLVYLMREVDSTLVDEDTAAQLFKDLDSIKLKLLKFRKKQGS